MEKEKEREARITIQVDDLPSRGTFYTGVTELVCKAASSVDDVKRYTTVLNENRGEYQRPTPPAEDIIY